jgi:hypothetical protein
MDAHPDPRIEGHLSKLSHVFEVVRATLVSDADSVHTHVVGE